MRLQSADMVTVWKSSFQASKISTAVINELKSVQTTTSTLDEIYHQFQYRQLIFVQLQNRSKYAQNYKKS